MLTFSTQSNSTFSNKVEKPKEVQQRATGINKINQTDQVHPQQICRWHLAEWCSWHTWRMGCHPERPGQAWEVGAWQSHEV